MSESDETSDRARQVYREFLISQLEQAIESLHDDETSVLAHDFDRSENPTEGIQTRSVSVKLQTSIRETGISQMHPKVAEHEQTAAPRGIERDSSDDK